MTSRHREALRSVPAPSRDPAPRPPARPEAVPPRHYPVFLDLAGRACLVVGGGPVAEAKVTGLRTAGARITVVSPTLTPQLATWRRDGSLRHRARPYRPGDARGYRLVFVAIDDPAVTEAVTRDARDHGPWVNAADDPGRCDFILPSILRRGRLAVAVSTGGACPGLARAIREQLERQFSTADARLIELAAEVRQSLRSQRRAPPGDAWRRALHPRLRRLLADGRRDAARAWLARRLRAEG
jgi:precorrin-2 dehydrogenase/sirohydrochlorin ferrochelatase